MRKARILAMKSLLSAFLRRSTHFRWPFTIYSEIQLWANENQIGGPRGSLRVGCSPQLYVFGIEFT